MPVRSAVYTLKVVWIVLCCLLKAGAGNLEKPVRIRLEYSKNTRDLDLNDPTANIPPLPSGLTPRKHHYD